MESPYSNNGDDEASYKKRSLRKDSASKIFETTGSLYDTGTDTSQHDGDFRNLSGPLSGFHQFGGV